MEENKLRKTWLKDLILIVMVILTIINIIFWISTKLTENRPVKENYCKQVGYQYTDLRFEHNYVKCCNVTEIIGENNLPRRGEICVPYFLTKEFADELITGSSLPFGQEINNGTD